MDQLGPCVNKIYVQLISVGIISGAVKSTLTLWFPMPSNIAPFVPSPMELSDTELNWMLQEHNTAYPR